MSSKKTGSKNTAGNAKKAHKAKSTSKAASKDAAKMPSVKSSAVNGGDLSVCDKSGSGMAVCGLGITGKACSPSTVAPTKVTAPSKVMVMDARDFVDMAMDKNGSTADDTDVIVKCDNAEENRFDVTVGALEDLLVEPRFAAAQNSFMEKYCEVFDDNEENKLAYMPIYQQYVKLLESLIESHLAQTVPSFSLLEFCKQASTKKEDDLSSDVVDVLLSLSDFSTFKFNILQFKRDRAARSNGPMLDDIISVRSLQARRS